jgi:hypothetical protein
MCLISSSSFLLLAPRKQTQENQCALYASGVAAAPGLRQAAKNAARTHIQRNGAEAARRTPLTVYCQLGISLVGKKNFQIF